MSFIYLYIYGVKITLYIISLSLSFGVLIHFYKIANGILQVKRICGLWFSVRL